VNDLCVIVKSGNPENLGKFVTIKRHAFAVDWLVEAHGSIYVASNMFGERLVKPGQTCLAHDDQLQPIRWKRGVDEVLAIAKRISTSEQISAQRQAMRAHMARKA
jgi:hypothetical protein